MTGAVPPPIGSDWKVWARQISDFVRRNLTRLQFRNGVDVATEDGIILWDEANGYPVVSKDGSYRQIVLADGYGQFVRTTDVTAASANTAYAVTFDTAVLADGVSIGSPASRIVMEEGGEYFFAFSCEIRSTSSSTVTFYFWPRINGVDIQNNTIINALHRNDAVNVVTRSGIFNVSAGDYLEVMWAVTDTAGRLNASAATAFSPAAPAATLSVSRFRA